MGMRSLCCVLGLCLAASVGPVSPLVLPASAAETAETETTSYARPADILLSGLSDTEYAAESRQWQGVSGVEVTRGGRIWSTFLTGGEREPSIENYVAYTYSDDGGLTWIDPCFVVVHPDENTRTIDPSLYLAADGSLWCMYTMASTSDPELQTGLFGNQETWRIRIGNPDADAQELRAQLQAAEPEFMSKGMKFNKIIELQNGDLMYFASNNPASKNIFVYASADGGSTFVQRGRIAGAGSDGAQYSLVEPMGVQLSDGTIRMMARIQLSGGQVVDGGLGYAESTNGGYTWTAFRGNLDAPMRGTVSRFAFYRLKSGHILFVYHDSEQNDRTRLAAWLSVDEGQTFPYKLLLDGRGSVSYPDVTQDAEGNIYVQYDRGRNAQSEIRLCIFTEQDVINGYFSSDSSVRLRVSVLGSLKDIVRVTTGFSQELSVQSGTTVQELRAVLPNEVEVVATDGETYTVGGVWEVGYGSLEEGFAILTLNANTDFIRYNLYDAHELLAVHVRVADGGGQGQGADPVLYIGLGVAGGCLATALVAVFLIVRSRRRKKMRPKGKS